MVGKMKIKQNNSINKENKKKEIKITRRIKR